MALDVSEETMDVFAITNDNVLICLSKKGSALWKHDMDEKVQKLAVSNDGKSFVLCTEGGSILSLERLEEDIEIFYEILCRGEKKCGTFVSVVYTDKCPRCSSDKTIVRIIKEKL